MLVGSGSGDVFNDANRNGIDDPAENGLAGWTVFVDTNNNGVLNAGERSTVTDINGRFAITGLTAASVGANKPIKGMCATSASVMPSISSGGLCRRRNSRHSSSVACTASAS